VKAFKFEKLSVLTMMDTDVRVGLSGTVPPSPAAVFSTATHYFVLVSHTYTQFEQKKSTHFSLMQNIVICLGGARSPVCVKSSLFMVTVGVRSRYAQVIK
jgi:hypothetical protein